MSHNSSFVSTESNRLLDTSIASNESEDFAERINQMNIQSDQVHKEDTEIRL